MSVATTSTLDATARVLTIVVAVGTGIMAGLYFAFSCFVMRALEDLAPAEGAAAMQSINRAVPNPVFLLVFLGTAVACVGLAIVAVVRWGDPASPRLLAGSVLSLGAFLLTIGYHVPLNDQLAALDPATADTARFWADYLSSWTPWNHVRTVGSIVALALLLTA